ncbi:MAG: MFS transporter [Hyphomonadaceae bacterium]
MTARPDRIASENPVLERERREIRKGAWLGLVLLCLVYVLNFLDRQLLSILSKPIQDELHLTDGQLGLLGGLFFAAFYCTISLPIAWIADRHNRVRIVGAACILWSAATAACGLARTYPELAIARMSVGVGEAGGVPPSYSIISDYFPPNKRGMAYGIYNLGPPIGQALGVAFGASVAASYSWRDAFVVLGVVGVAAGIAVFFLVREPMRGEMDKAVVAKSASAERPLTTHSDPPRPRFWNTFGMFLTRPVLLLVALAAAATQFITYAVLNFTTLFLMREKGMTLEEVALWYALMIGFGIGAGVFFSGWLLDRWAPRTERAYAWLPAIGLTLAAPMFIAFVWAPEWRAALMFLALPTALNYFFLSPAVALVQAKVAPAQRTLAGAILLLIMNMVGLGFGPTYLGAMSDIFSAQGHANPLQLAFYTLTPFYLVAIVLYLLLSRALARETKPVRARS